jgi:hypothetical protein
MNHKLKYSIVAIIGILALPGCAGYDRILFVTKTNVGLDVDNKPPTEEIDQQGVVVPPNMLVFSSQAGWFRERVAGRLDCCADGPCCSVSASVPS